MKNTINSSFNHEQLASEMANKIVEETLLLLKNVNKILSQNDVKNRD